MQRFIWILLVLVLSVWLGIQIAADPGYALFYYRHWSVEMPLWFAIVVLILILFVLYCVLRFFDGISSSIYRIKNWLRWRRKNKSYNKTNKGLVDLIEGNWRSAEYYLLDGIPQSNAPLINYLAAAKAAHEQGAYDKRDAYLKKAHDVAPHAELAIGLTQAQLQLSQGQLEQALATLDRLRQIAPKNSYVLKLLQKLYIRLADWNALLNLLPLLRKAKLINAEQLEKLERKCYQELLQAAASKSEKLAAIHQVWRNIPKKLQRDPTLVALYVKELIAFPLMADEANALINKIMKKTWDKELARLYGLLITNDPSKQLACAEAWHKYYGQQAVLLLTLGRLSTRCQLWGKARSYFEESIKLEANPETYFEYGKLLEQLGELNSASHQYQEGLLLIYNKNV